LNIGKRRLGAEHTRTEPRLTFNAVNAMGDYAWKALSLTASDLVNGAQSLDQDN
jgi:hypothetical protein